MEIKLFETLKKAYESSSRRFNNFKEAIEKIKWDSTFEADGEIYFVKDGFSLTVENLDPFEEKRKPTAYFSDNSIITF